MIPLDALAVIHAVIGCDNEEAASSPRVFV